MKNRTDYSGEEPLEKTTVWISQETLDWYEMQARRVGLKRTQLMRLILAEAMQHPSIINKTVNLRSGE